MPKPTMDIEVLEKGAGFGHADPASVLPGTQLERPTKGQRCTVTVTLGERMIGKGYAVQVGPVPKAEGVQTAKQQKETSARAKGKGKGRGKTSEDAEEAS